MKSISNDEHSFAEKPGERLGGIYFRGYIFTYVGVLWFLSEFLSGVMGVPTAHHLGLQLLISIFLVLLDL